MCYSDFYTEEFMREHREMLVAINGTQITASDPMVEHCGYCGRRIEACKADRRMPERCDEAPSGWRDRPGQL